MIPYFGASVYDDPAGLRQKLRHHLHQERHHPHPRRWSATATASVPRPSPSSSGTPSATFMSPRNWSFTPTRATALPIPPTAATSCNAPSTGLPAICLNSRDQGKKGTREREGASAGLQTRLQIGTCALRLSCGATGPFSPLVPAFWSLGPLVPVLLLPTRPRDESIQQNRLTDRFHAGGGPVLIHFFLGVFSVCLASSAACGSVPPQCSSLGAIHLLRAGPGSIRGGDNSFFFTCS